VIDARWMAAQVVALRAAVGAVQAQVDVLADALERLQAEPPSCTHRRKDNVGTIGAPVWECLDCGARWDEVAAS
jgi:ribosomal protein L37AE/L43A